MLSVWLASHNEFVAAAAICVAAISLVLGIIGLTVATNLSGRLKKWKGIHSTADLEQVYADTLEQVRNLRRQLEESKGTIEKLERQLATKVSTPRVIRYNAFSNQGSDLSFSVALVDDYENGVVVSSIYGREDSRVYAKPVEHGTSEYPLTDEESLVLNGEPQLERRPVRV